MARDEGPALAAGRVGRRVLKAWYSARYLAHAPLGLMNCTPQVSDELVEPWVPTQMPRIGRESAACVLSFAAASVQVVVSLPGGALGRRLEVDYAELEVWVEWTVGLKSSSSGRVSKPPGTMTTMVRTHATPGARQQATSLEIKLAGDAVPTRWIEQSHPSLNKPVETHDKTVFCAV